jgi:hypothetical protein
VDDAPESEGLDGGSDGAPADAQTAPAAGSVGGGCTCVVVSRGAAPCDRGYGVASIAGLVAAVARRVRRRKKPAS